MAITEGVNKLITPNNQHIVTPRSCKIITSLADGVERIAVKEAIDVLNAQLEVFLPIIEDEYKNTLLSDESRTEFDNLVLNAASIESFIDKPLKEKYPGKEFHECWQEVYQRFQEELITRCDVLITLTEDNENDYGEYAKVKYARVINKPILIIPCDTNKGFHIENYTRRIEEELESFEFINNYNTKTNKYQKKIKQSNDEFINNALADKLTPDNIETVKRVLLPVYTKISLIAARYQNLYKNSGLAVYLFSPFAVVMVSLAIYYQDYSNVFYSIEFILLFIILFVIRYADKKRTHRKWLYHRYLAELLRSTIYLALAGKKQGEIKITPDLRVAHKPNEWMIKFHSQVIEKIEKRICTTNNLEAVKYFITEGWLNNQIEYHGKNAIKLSKRNHDFEWYGWIIFGTALILAFSHLILSAFDLGEGFEVYYEIVPFLAISLPAFGASVGAIRNHREYARLSRRSKNMCQTLEYLKDECSKIKTNDELKLWLKKAEKIMLRESQDWLMLMKYIKLDAI
ncbi:MAG: hypothetical protein HUU54_05570 [Ignavibacteriaceae bacterium]|nr:hypothetical protein [Ignavibacteriaceae bacterium]